jgi:hypothetical protein
MAITEFEKDFGYLMPFLDKIAAAASTLPDRGGRSELAQLIADEKRRWARIRQLLSGTASTGESQPVAAVGGEATSATVKLQPSFTVGSLRQRKS